MWHNYQIQIAEQHQHELRQEAEKWRLINRKETYQPNQAIHNIKRKRKTGTDIR